MRSRRPWVWTRWLAICFVIGGLAGCAGSDRESSRLKSVNGLVAWMAGHREHVGLVVLRDGAAVPEISVNADELFPLASTKKVLILGAYASAVAAGRLAPDQLVDLSAVERWYWPGSDGGAHSRAVVEWRDTGALRQSQVPLSAVAQAMIRWSDNAAADYVMERVGGPAAVERFAASLGMVRQDPVFGVLGEFAAWSTDATQWLRAVPAERAALATAAAARTRPPLLPRLPTVDLQRQLSQTDSAGTPAEWARLMSGVRLGPAPSPAVRSTMATLLNWPRTTSPEVAAHFSDFATKGGSLPGVITEASHIQPMTRRGVSIAIFLRGLPERIETELLQSYLHQALERRLATDPSFALRVKRALAG